jgi:hypothetical protein
MELDIAFNDVLMVGNDLRGSVHHWSALFEHLPVEESLQDHFQSDAVDIAYAQAYFKFAHSCSCDLSVLSSLFRFIVVPLGHNSTAVNTSPRCKNINFIHQ